MKLRTAYPTRFLDLFSQPYLRLHLIFVNLPSGDFSRETIC
ncbi:hypothetical protein C789_3223 [Microcystis aeruginosa FACHB-905 = DIANCHI905]|nr:hypothetical protein C789_3223 [Microcystis aeruginosa FACHB-905 = DIANCHI905]